MYNKRRSAVRADANVRMMRDFEASQVCFFGPAKVNAGGKGMSLRMGDANGQPIRLKVPECLTFGIDDYKDEHARATGGPGNGKYSMKLAFPETEEFAKFAKEVLILEDRFCKFVWENNEAIFGESKSENGRSWDSILDTFTSALSHTKDKITKKVDKSRPPLMTVKTNRYGTFTDHRKGVTIAPRWEPKLFDENKKQIFPTEDDPKQEKINESTFLSPVELVPKMSKATTIIELNGGWMVSLKHGTIWKLMQAIVKPPTERQDLTDLGWVSDDEGEEEDAPDEIESKFCPPKPAEATPVDEPIPVAQAEYAPAEEAEIVHAEAPPVQPEPKEASDTEETNSVVDGEDESMDDAPPAPVAAAEPKKKVTLKRAMPTSEAAASGPPTKKKIIVRK